MLDFLTEYWFFLELFALLFGQCLYILYIIWLCPHILYSAVLLVMLVCRSFLIVSCSIFISIFICQIFLLLFAFSSFDVCSGFIFYYLSNDYFILFVFILFIYLLFYLINYVTYGYVIYWLIFVIYGFNAVTHWQWLNGLLIIVNWKLILILRIIWFARCIVHVYMLCVYLMAFLVFPVLLNTYWLLDILCHYAVCICVVFWFISLNMTTYDVLYILSYVWFIEYDLLVTWIRVASALGGLKCLDCGRARRVAFFAFFGIAICVFGIVSNSLFILACWRLSFTSFGIIRFHSENVLNLLVVLYFYRSVVYLFIYLSSIYC